MTRNNTVTKSAKPIKSPTLTAKQLYFTIACYGTITISLFLNVRAKKYIYIYRAPPNKNLLLPILIIFTEATNDPVLL